MVEVFMKSQLTGVTHCMDIPADEDKIRRYLAGQIPGHIQNVFPELSADAREFLMTGITPQEWDEYVADPDEDDDDTA